MIAIVLAYIVLLAAGAAVAERYGTGRPLGAYWAGACLGSLGVMAIVLVS